ncbi:hypothetical protein MTR_6g025550 [Medicago truncatula]|uniref:Protein FAR1-RELATED SEQUENCE n=1 Tax=Medicago truncatula TaxID=3880 RepID=G7KP45_MEDTR|nr:hypothetical protein MTR_6g025550 [Medicago truncatula]
MASMDINYYHIMKGKHNGSSNNENPGFFHAFQMDTEVKLVNCLWVVLSHIHHEHSEFKNQIYKCIQQYTTVKEFDFDWEALINKYVLQDTQWVKTIYSIREKWISRFCDTQYKKALDARYNQEKEKTF